MTSRSLILSPQAGEGLTRFRLWVQKKRMRQSLKQVLGEHCLCQLSCSLPYSLPATRDLPSGLYDSNSVGSFGFLFFVLNALLLTQAVLS